MVFMLFYQPSYMSSPFRSRAEPKQHYIYARSSISRIVRSAVAFAACRVLFVLIIAFHFLLGLSSFPFPPLIVIHGDKLSQIVVQSFRHSACLFPSSELGFNIKNKQFCFCLGTCCEINRSRLRNRACMSLSLCTCV